MAIAGGSFFGVIAAVQQKAAEYCRLKWQQSTDLLHRSKADAEIPAAADG
jgi:hypothetical protein